MKLGLFIAFILTLTLGALGQSGRVKPSESPTPLPTVRPTAVYVPTQLPTAGTSPISKPSPSTKPGSDSEEPITVDSALVPIPVSVVDAIGRAITNLRLADFELRIDGKPVEIGELSRS